MARILIAMAIAAMSMTLVATPTEAADSTASSPSGGLSPTAVSILIVGVVVVLALIAILWWFMRRRQTKHQPPLPTTVTAMASPSRDDASLAGVFRTASSPPSSSSYSKNPDSFTSGSIHVDARANSDSNPSIKAPTHAPYAAYHRSDVVPSLRHGRLPGGEPLLYNRETSTTLRVTDSTRSYLYEPTTPPDRLTAPQIFGSKNSVDFTYTDTDRSTTTTIDERRGFRDLDDSNRSNASSDAFGFVVHTNESAQVFSVSDMDSGRSSRPYTDDSTRSARRYSYSDEVSGRTTVYNEDLATNTLSAEEIRHLKVEL